MCLTPIPICFSVASSFKRAQCLLMVAADPHPYAAPYPDREQRALQSIREYVPYMHFQVTYRPSAMPE